MIVCPVCLSIYIFCFRFCFAHFYLSVPTFYPSRTIIDINPRPQVFNSFLTVPLVRPVVVMARKDQNPHVVVFQPSFPPILLPFLLTLFFVYYCVYLGGSHTGTFEFIKKHGYVPYGTFAISIWYILVFAVENNVVIIIYTILINILNMSFALLKFITLDTCQPYLACSNESTEGFCPHVDTTCSAINTCKTCDTFGGMVR